MDCDLDTLRAFLVTAGCPEDIAWSLPDETPLPLPPPVCVELARALTMALGIPTASAALIEGGSLADWRDFVMGVIDDHAVRRAAITRLRARPIHLPDGVPWEVGRLRPIDALGAASLFLDIYEDRYPVVDYYVPERVIALNRRDEVVTVVARLPDGTVAGQSALYRGPAFSPRVYECGQLHLARACRLSSLAYRLAAGIDQVRPTLRGVDSFFNEAVCTHLVSQKLSAKFGYVEQGIELSLMPSGTYDKEGHAGRVTCSLSFIVARDELAPLHLPASHRAVMEDLLAATALRRTVTFAETDSPEAAETVLSARVFEFASVERVQVERIGRDFAAAAGAITERGDRLGLAVTQVYLNASAPGTAFAVGVLKRLGFIFSAFAPWWFGTGDGFLMQRLAAPPDFDGIQLWSETSKCLLAHIRAEWETRECAR